MQQKKKTQKQSVKGNILSYPFLPYEVEGMKGNNQTIHAKKETLKNN